MKKIRQNIYSKEAEVIVLEEEEEILKERKKERRGQSVECNYEQARKRVWL